MIDAAGQTKMRECSAWEAYNIMKINSVAIKVTAPEVWIKGVGFQKQNCPIQWIVQECFHIRSDIPLEGEGAANKTLNKSEGQKPWALKLYLRIFQERRKRGLMKEKLLGCVLA